MPRDLAENNETLYSRNSFTPISVADIQRLQAARLSGTTTRVYLLLKQHCWNGKTTCFPSLKRLADMLELKHNSALKTICRSLKELEDAGMIERNGRKQKNRFVLLPEKREESELPKVGNLPKTELPKTGNKKNELNETKEEPPLPSVERREYTQKPKKRKEYNRKWRSKEERRAAKAERAAARAERQRAEQREAQRTNPVERQKRLRNALDWIALRMPVECLMEGDKEHLEHTLDEWISGLSEQRRKLFKIKCDKTFRSEMIRRIGEM